MSTRYTTVDGDCLSSIAASHGLPSYEVIHSDAENGALKARRPSPNLLAVGDVVNIPDARPKTVSVAVGTTARFVVQTPKTRLHVVVHGLVGEPLAGAAYKLSGARPNANFIHEGNFDGAGLLDVPIPPDTTAVILEATLPPPPAPPTPPSDGLVVPAEVFTLKKESPRPESQHTSPTSIVWTLSLGTLYPTGSSTDAQDGATFTIGAQRRLANLGYAVPTNGTMDEPSKKALFAFQDEHGQLETVPLSQRTADKLLSVHDGTP